MRFLIALENAALMVGFIAMYFLFGFDWVMFAVLFFAPDLSFVAYVAGPKIGAWVYNLAHHFGVAVILMIYGWLVGPMFLVAIGLIMAAHIFFDRMLGYGLKHESGFKDTHLGRIGKD